MAAENLSSNESNQLENRNMDRKRALKQRIGVILLLLNFALVFAYSISNLFRHEGEGGDWVSRIILTLLVGAIALMLFFLSVAWFIHWQAKKNRRSNIVSHQKTSS